MKFVPNFGLGILSNVAFLGHPKTDPHSSIRPCISSTASFGVNNFQGSNLLFSLNVMNWGRSSEDANERLVVDKQPTETVKIGIVGGGICGNSVAHSLAKKLLQKEEQKQKKYEIVVLEGDPHSAVTTSLSTIAERQNAAPLWHAATARNANSIVPGSAMHVFSRKSVLWQLIHDTIEEWYCLKKEYLQNAFSNGSLTLSRQDDFAETPPYFALHLWKCLGPSASSEERLSFVRFMRHFLISTIYFGQKEANQRGQYMCELATANRDIFLRETKDLNEKGHDIKFTRGFLALYRSPEGARHSQETTLEHGEEARLLEWDEAVAKEPRLENLPVKPLYVVHRPNEIISSCDEFFCAWTQEMRKLGVQFRGPQLVDRLEMVKVNGNPREKKIRYRVCFKDGAIHEFDILVLAAGVHTPLLAAQLGVADYVPTYPLRGFSLTTFVGLTQKKTENVLKQPFSVDSMYCTSVTPWMARWAGFGEFVGYPGKDKNVPSLGPSVLSRYTRSVFPDADKGINGTESSFCFRPVSPDDLPLVGAIPSRPGLFVHSGHGTLGWTTGLATGQCVAQTIAESLNEAEASSDNDDQKKYFHFPNGIKIERKLLSPARFSNSKS